MKKRLRMLVQASMACMLALSSVALPAQVHAASETQIVSDISISSLRDVKNLERGGDVCLHQHLSRGGRGAFSAL